MTKWDLRILSIRDEELRKRLGIESLDEIFDRGCMNRMEKVAKIPATLEETYYHVNYLLLGDLEVRGKRQRGGQLKTLRKSYLGLLHPGTDLQ